MEERSADLLRAGIARSVYRNQKAVFGLLFRASAQTVTTIAAASKRMGAKVAMTSVLHTKAVKRVGGIRSGKRVGPL